MRNNLLLFAVISLLAACKTTRPNQDAAFFTTNDGIQVLLVANHNRACPGPELSECLLVKAENEQDWKFLRDPIEGFFYEAGYEYKLKVRVHKVLNPAPGGSTNLYNLLEVLEKKPSPPDMRLYDIWAFESAADKPALNALPLEKKPMLEINLTEKRFGGNAPCNQYFGQIETYGSYIRFSGMGSTMMACDNGKAESEYFAIFTAANTFKIENLRLILYRDGKEIARFRKID